MNTTVVLYIIFVLLYILFFIFIGYMCIVADPETNKTAKYITETLPNILQRQSRKILGTKLINSLEIISEYSLAILYLVIVLGSWSIIFAYVYPWVDEENSGISPMHKIFGYVIFVSCMVSWRTASRTSPGIITKHTLIKYDNYPYDNLLFVPNRICPTVGIKRLARSKYDRLLNIHIPRYDHFCGWIHNAVGEENYKYFLTFVFIQYVMCTYGSIICCLLFYNEINNNNLLNATFYDISTGLEVQATYYVIIQYMFRKRFEVSCLIVLLITMSITLGIFFFWHVWITSRGMTTNEAYKWSDVRKWYKKEIKRYNEYNNKKSNKLTMNNNKDHQSSLSCSTTETSVSNSSSNNNNNINKSMTVVTNDDNDVTCTGSSSSTSSISNVTLTKAADDNSNSNHDTEEEEVVQHPGPMPKNMYNKGIIENWKEVLYPRSLRKDAIERYKKYIIKMNQQQQQQHNNQINSNDNNNKNNVISSKNNKQQ